MCLSLTCYMSEISNWFDVHFAISKFSKGMILKLHIYRTYFLKTLELLRIYFSKKALKFLGLLLFPWRFWAKENFTPGNMEKLCYTTGKFHFLSWSPLNILHVHAVSSIRLEIPCLQPPLPPCFFLK